MAHVAYLTLKGEKQGLISSGCNTKDSMGNRYQETHTDQITVLACHYSLSKLPHQHGIHHDGIQITKPKDKASPLLATAFAKQEHLEGTLDFYRTNERGHDERFYSVAFQKAVISGVTDVSPHAVHCPGEEMHEMITFRYKGVQWEHFPCGTLAYDGWADANGLDVMAPPLTSAERYARQIKEAVQADKAAEQQAEKEKRIRRPNGQFAPGTEPKPSLGRPSLRAKTKRDIQAQAEAEGFKDKDGNFTDEQGNVLSDWNYGHKTGHENRRILKAADELGMSQTELNDFVNAHPDYFQIEDAKRNLSHKDEKPGTDDLRLILRDMRKFLKNRDTQ